MLTACLLVLLLLIYALRTRWRLLHCWSKAELLPPRLPGSPDSVDSWLKDRDLKEAPIQPGSESEIVWGKLPGSKTELCVVYLHGWSASPPEVSPVCERVAAALEANLLRFRYTAHGLSPMERGGNALLTEQSHEVLRHNAATALALGGVLGKRVVLVGCSTGGALSLWLSAQQWIDSKLMALVLLSPGIRLTMNRAVWEFLSWLLLLLPKFVSILILQFVNGGQTKRQRSLAPGMRGEAQAKCWTRAYPVGAVLHVIGLFVICGHLAFEKISVPVLAFANPADPGASFEATRQTLPRIPLGELEVIRDSENAHVITGSIMSPSTVEHVVRRSVEFLKRAM